LHCSNHLKECKAVFNRLADRQPQLFKTNQSQYILFKTDDGFEVWSADMTRMITSIVISGFFSGNVAVSPDGGLIAYDEQYQGELRVVVLETETGTVISILKEMKTAITSMVFSSNGKYLLTSGYDLNAKLWNTTSGKCLRILGGHASPVVSIAISPNLQFIACGCQHGDLHLYAFSTESQLNPRFVHNAFVSETAFLRGFIEDDNFISKDENNRLRTWNVKTGQFREETVYLTRRHPAFEYKQYFARDNCRVKSNINDESGETIFVLKDRNEPIAWFNEQVKHPDTQSDCRIWIGHLWDQVFLLSLEGDF
jgi:WD40 repeat protein